MSVTYAGSGNWAGPVGTTLAPPVPFTAAGDLLIYVIASASGMSHITPSGGWTIVTSVSNGAANAPMMTVYSKTALANEAVNYPMTATPAGQFAEAVILRYTGNQAAVDTTVTNTGFSSTPTLSSITPGHSPSLLVGLAALIGPSYPNSFTGAPSGMAKRADVGFYNLETAVFDQALTTTQASGTRVSSASTAGQWATTALTLYESGGPSQLSTHGSLDANAVTSVSISAYNTVEVTNRAGFSEIFFTVDGSTPLIEGANTFCLPATICSMTVPSTGSSVVRMISAGSTTFSVTKQS